PHRGLLSRRLRRRRPRLPGTLRPPGRVRHADEVDRGEPAAGRPGPSTIRSAFERRLPPQAAALAAPGRAHAGDRGGPRLSPAAPAAVGGPERAPARRHAAHLLPDAVVGAPLLPPPVRLAGRARRGPTRLSVGALDVGPARLGQPARAAGARRRRVAAGA